MNKYTRQHHKGEPKKEMEYEEAPSGFVTLYNVKEPFMRYEKGYGYEGVLLFDGINDTTQCHLCGEWFLNLPHHIHKEHNTTAAEYKKEVGLEMTSVLISESFRAKLILKNMGKRKKNLRNRKGIPHTEEAKRKISEGLSKLTRERQNKTGTCPEQLIERLQKKYQELGYTPNRPEFGAYTTLIRVYGSMKEACQIAGIPYNGRGKPRNHKPRITSISGLVYTSDILVRIMRSFHRRNGRWPSTSDCRRGLMPSQTTYKNFFGSWSKALKAAQV